MKNKGYAEIGGQTRCIIGDLQMANIEHNGLLVRVPPGTCSRWTTPKSSLTRFKTKRSNKPSSRTKRLHNLDEIKSSFEMASL